MKGTPFDFRRAHKIGEKVGEVEGGYDHCLVLKYGKEVDKDLAFIARCGLYTVSWRN